MAPGSANVLDDILGEGEGLYFDDSARLSEGATIDVGEVERPERLASTESIAPDEISRDAAVSESAGHAQVLPEQAEGADEDEHTHSRRTVGEHVQFVRGNTCPGFRRVWQSRSALHPPPLTHFQICSPRTCVHATSLLRRTADLAANRWPEPPLPTDLPTPALVISLPHLLLLRPLGSGLFPCFGSMRAPQP